MIFIVHGKDSFRRQLKINSLKEQYLNKEMEAMNFNSIENPSLVDFISLVKTPSWMGNKVIIIKNFKALENKSEDSEVKQILETLGSIPETNIVIFDSEKVTGTIKLFKQIKSKLKSITEFHDYLPFSPWDNKKAVSWLMEISKDIKAQAAELLVEQIGSEDSSKLHSELQRLLTLSKTVDEKLIIKECNARHDIFKFIRILAEGNLSKANQELEKIIKSKEAHLGLVSVMETTVSRYLKLKLALSERKSKEEMAEILGISPGRLYYQQQEVAKMQTPYLEKLLDKTLNAERDVKTGRMPVERALRLLVNR